MDEDDTVAEKPLLSLPTTVRQFDRQSILFNLISGTSILAQGGVCGLVLIVLSAVRMVGFALISGHILLNTTGLLLAVQAILLLQPTHTAEQKRRGTMWHFICNVGSLSGFLSGLVFIEVNKFAHRGAHLKSPHAYLGLFTYLVLLLQGLVGFTQYYTPMLYGSVDRAKSIWKYHRAAGYMTVVLASSTVAAAMCTEYNQNVLRIPAWVMFVALVLVLCGVLTRIRLAKFGFKV